jgi:hypothetical protein
LLEASLEFSSKKEEATTITILLLLPCNLLDIEGIILLAITYH